MKSKLKEMGQKAFVKMGNVAVGNDTKAIENNNAPVPFTGPALWLYEKSMPKREN